MNKENCALKLVDEIILYYDARSKKHQNTTQKMNVQGNIVSLCVTIVTVETKQCVMCVVQVHVTVSYVQIVIKFYSQQLMHFLIQIYTDLLSYIKRT